MKTNPINEFVLKSEQNFRIASAIADAWPDIRQKVGGDFLDRLQARLARRIMHLEFERGVKFFADPGPMFSLWKTSWRGDYAVNLQFSENGRKMVFGMGRDFNANHIKRRPRCDDLLNAVAKDYPSAIGNNWWEAQIPMKSPASDWSTPECLWRIKTTATALRVSVDRMGFASTLTDKGS